MTKNLGMIDIYVPIPTTLITYLTFAYTQASFAKDMVSIIESRLHHLPFWLSLHQNLPHIYPLTQKKNQIEETPNQNP